MRSNISKQKKFFIHICVSNKGKLGGDPFEIEETNTAAGFPFSLSNIALWWSSTSIISSSCKETLTEFLLQWWISCDFSLVPFELLTATTESGWCWLKPPSKERNALKQNCFFFAN